MNVKYVIKKFLNLFIKLKYQRQSPSKSPLNIFAKNVQIYTGYTPFSKGEPETVAPWKGEMSAGQRGFCFDFF